jgi:protein-S-isoprenylcysteine O-methyltransferase Ste14
MRRPTISTVRTITSTLFVIALASTVHSSAAQVRVFETHVSQVRDSLIYAFHSIFWIAFFARSFRKRALKSDVASQATPPRNSPSGAMLPALVVYVLHGVAFGVMYGGIVGVVARGAGVALLFRWPWVIGASVIAAGAAIIAWALYVFESWRFLARLSVDHKLCTIGPYAHIRHPIYLACDLLAIGSFLWLPTIATGIAMILMIVTGDLRARREEAVLRDTFGEEYRRYELGVKRYLPGVY